MKRVALWLCVFFMQAAVSETADNLFRHVSAPSCSADQLLVASGSSSHDIVVEGKKRRYVQFVPSFYSAEVPLSLWILAPGAWNEPEKQVAMSELERYAEEQQFAFVALKGHDNLMNVFLHSKEKDDLPDDVAYTEAVLDEVTARLCIDARRVFCTGYSRGARFCMRLASELSHRIAAVAPVSGVRFPEPNNATRPVPLVAFHGTADPVNPFSGNGNPEYWDASVEDAIEKWVKFNGCSVKESHRLRPHVLVERHIGCTANSNVVLVKIEGGGHVWPGSQFDWDSGLGHITHEINASVMIGQFFNEHPMPWLDIEDQVTIGDRIHVDPDPFLNPHDRLPLRALFVAAVLVFCVGMLISIAILLVCGYCAKDALYAGTDDDDDDDDDSYEEDVEDEFNEKYVS